MKKTIMINGIPYTAEICNYSRTLYTVYICDNDNNNICMFSQDFEIKSNEIPNYIEMVQKTRESFKQELVTIELRKKARAAFEEWDGGEASSEAPNSEVSA